MALVKKLRIVWYIQKTLVSAEEHKNRSKAELKLVQIHFVHFSTYIYLST